MTETDIATIERQIVFNADAIEKLRSGLRGAALLHSEDGYDAARKIYNAMIDHRPAAIVRCAGVADVICAVNFARDNGLLVSVRGGGHNVSGNAVSDGGLMPPRSHDTSCKSAGNDVPARRQDIGAGNGDSRGGDEWK